jgi:hypothetical protein
MGRERVIAGDGRSGPTPPVTMGPCGPVNRPFAPNRESDTPLDVVMTHTGNEDLPLDTARSDVGGLVGVEAPAGPAIANRCGTSAVSSASYPPAR